MTARAKPLLAGLMLLASIHAGAQGSETFEQFKARSQARFQEYREQKRKDFEEFRRKRNEEFAKFLRKDWTPASPEPEIPSPKDEMTPPVMVPDEEPQPLQPAPNPLPFKEVVPAPAPQTRPEPIAPIEEVPVTPEVSTHPFFFLGTRAEVRLDSKQAIRLAALSENGIADAWLTLSREPYTNLIYDCLQLRDSLDLCDWAYLLMLQQMAESICGQGTNEAILLMAYVYCQSGYKMRLARDNEQLYMMFATHHHIFNRNYFNINGEHYYPYPVTLGDVILCPQQFPNELPMSLLIEKEPKFAMAATEGTIHQSARNKQVSASIIANRNRLDFYASYPTSTLGTNPLSRWAMYANMPMPESIRQQLYPQLLEAIHGMQPLQAADCLLNWIQTGFQYEMDYNVWGGDRAFFPEETLFYPFCDCEDRAILYTRIIRDLIGLECVLVYYPQHLACAVCLPGTVNGDYFELEGKRFTITDPTYIGASVGMTMPSMDNSQAQVILLE